MIVLDLEWNNGYDRKRIDEILQIGAVRLNTMDGPIADTFCAHIRPSIHKKFSPAAKHLPELQRSVDSALDFPAAYAAFLDWCGADRTFALWGGDDLKALRDNCDYYALAALEPEKTYDFQRAFSAMLDESRQVRLCDAVEYLRIPDTFCFHNALHDAVYTALVGLWMGERLALADKPPKEKKRRGWKFDPLDFPKQPKKRVGPLDDPDTLLNARAARKPACPLCRSKCAVSAWYYTDPRFFFGPVRCPEHGAFLSRLTVTAAESGGFVGTLAVPQLTPQLVAQFEQAFAANCHPCKSARRHRRWPHRRGRQTKTGERMEHR